LGVADLGLVTDDAADVDLTTVIVEGVAHSRRLIMHHDRVVPIALAWVRLAEARMLARRLAFQAG
jgi:hypothetical protein